MANDNQTALMMSIQRKKYRLLELKQQLLYSNPTGFTYESNINARIDELKDHITEDEKLLAVEREQHENTWIMAGGSFSLFDEQYLVTNGKAILICGLLNNGTFHGIGGATHWMPLPTKP